MPVTHNGKSWCYGSKCGYKSKKDAEAVQRAVHAKEGNIIHKATNFDDERRLALFVVYAPDEYDAHGDMSVELEIEKGCHSFNKHCGVANLFHLKETENAEIVESYIAPADMTVGDTDITKGTWLQVWSFPETNDGESLWQLTKSGEFGVSLGCRAKAHIIDED